jgi:hypothetical protein
MEQNQHIGLRADSLSADERLAIAFGDRSSARTHALTLHPFSAPSLVFAVEADGDSNAKTMVEQAANNKAASGVLNSGSIIV